MTSTPANTQPLLATQEQQEESRHKVMLRNVAKKVALFLAAIALFVFVVAWIIQGIIFWWATSFSGCSAGNLKDYSFPGGGKSDLGGPAFNLVPRISLLAEREPMFYGQAFDVIPSNEASTAADAPTGAWWRTWGPWFYTYTYEDVATSKTTVYMRENLLKIGMSHKVVRCDGTGPTIWIVEGGNFIGNRIRKAFKMNQGFSFKVYSDNDLIGLIEETNNGVQSLTFRNTTGEKFASSILQNRHFHGKYDEWLDNNEESSPLPYYASQAATLLYAINIIQSTPDKGSDDKYSSPAFLAAETLTNTSTLATETVETKVATILKNAAPESATKDLSSQTLETAVEHV